MLAKRVTLMKGAQQDGRIWATDFAKQAQLPSAFEHRYVESLRVKCIVCGLEVHDNLQVR